MPIQNSASRIYSIDREVSMCVCMNTHTHKHTCWLVLEKKGKVKSLSRV